MRERHEKRFWLWFRLALLISGCMIDARRSLLANILYLEMMRRSRSTLLGWWLRGGWSQVATEALHPGGLELVGMLVADWSGH